MVILPSVPPIAPTASEKYANLDLSHGMHMIRVDDNHIGSLFLSVSVCYCYVTYMQYVCVLHLMLRQQFALN